MIDFARSRPALFIASLVVVGVLARLMPHAPNASPVAAIALFAGWATGRATLGALAAALVMIASDLIIGGHEPGVMATVYLAIAAPAVIGPLLRRLPNVQLRFGGALAGAAVSSLAFYASTNAAVWAFSGMYPATADGLAASYLAGLPFLRFTLAGDLIWTLAFFGAAALVDQTRAIAR